MSGMTSTDQTAFVNFLEGVKDVEHSLDFETGATHIVAQKISRSEKMLCRWESFWGFLMIYPYSNERDIHDKGGTGSKLAFFQLMHTMSVGVSDRFSEYNFAN